MIVKQNGLHIQNWMKLKIKVLTSLTLFAEFDKLASVHTRMMYRSFSTPFIFVCIPFRWIHVCIYVSLLKFSCEYFSSERTCVSFYFVFSNFFDFGEIWESQMFINEFGRHGKRYSNTLISTLSNYGIFLGTKQIFGGN